MVYGDSAYRPGTHLAWLDTHGLTPMITTQLPTAPGGRFAKDQFRVDLQAQTVTCPALVQVAIIPSPSRWWGGPGSAPRAASARCATPAPPASGGGWSLSSP